MFIRVVDTETTGLPDKPDKHGPHAICEIGFSDVHWHGGLWTVDPPWSTMVNPQRPIPPEASAVHHIIDQDVFGAPLLADILPFVFPDAAKRNSDPGIPTAIAAHYAKFERAFLSPQDYEWICTHRCAVMAWDEAPGHSNQILRYWLKLPIGTAFASPPHRSGPDSYVTAHILGELLDQRDIRALIDWSNYPVVLPKVTFGKYKGMKWEDVPADYMRWYLRQGDQDEDVHNTCLFYLNERLSRNDIVHPMSLGDK
jgi:exodeoxyribonuclease X